MIPVALAAIAELVGETPSKKRRGPKRNKVAEAREQIPPDDFPPFWREVLPDMLQSYHRLCAYLALYIPHATGNPSVDHVVPKSKSWDKVYEWSNYRLASAYINGKKSDFDLALDPMSMKAGSFGLEFVAFQVVPGPKAKGTLVKQVDETILILGLNSLECRKAREKYVVDYQTGPGKGGIDLAYLEIHAPFIAQELRRQGLLVRGDV